MDGAEDAGAELDRLARDWITLWQSELTALASDPEAVEAWTRLMSLWAASATAALSMMPRGGPAHDPSAAWPFAPPGAAPAGAPPDARGVARNGGGGGDGVLARILERLDGIERRLAALEVGRGRRTGRGAGAEAERGGTRPG